MKNLLCAFFIFSMCATGLVAKVESEEDSKILPIEKFQVSHKRVNFDLEEITEDTESEKESDDTKKQI